MIRESKVARSLLKYRESTLLWMLSSHSRDTLFPYAKRPAQRLAHLWSLTPRQTDEFVNILFQTGIKTVRRFKIPIKCK